jgi:hypothetical protein
MSAKHGHERALVLATWALVAATVVLVIVTGLLAAATYEEKHRTEAPAVATTQEVHSR